MMEYSSNIKEQILHDIRNAKTSIIVAVSWLTDVDLIEELILSAKKGLSVQVVVSNSVDNLRQHTLISKLKMCGGEIKRWGANDPLEGSFMHYKFYVIDGKIAKSGSYNWTKSAISNKETLDAVDVIQKRNEFEDIFISAKDFFEPFPLHEKRENKDVKEDLIKNFNDSITTQNINTKRVPTAAYYALNLKFEKEEMRFWEARIKAVAKIGGTSIGYEFKSGPIDDSYLLLDSYYFNSSSLVINKEAYKVIFNQSPVLDLTNATITNKAGSHVYYSPKLKLDKISMCFNFELSEFVRNRLLLKFKSHEDYKNQLLKWAWAERKKQWPEADKLHIEIKKLVLNVGDGISEVFEYHNKIYFSEHLIKKIKQSGLTGFSFEDD